MNPVNIICMKWGRKYGADYVNRLYSMLSRHVKRDFLLTCFTEQPEGIVSEVNIQPLPELGLPSDIPERGWNKLATLREGLGGLSGQALFLDLDVVIVDSIDDLFDHPGDFLIIRDRKFKRRLIGNSSVYRFQIGQHQDVLERFLREFESVRQQFRNEQAYLTQAILAKGQLQFWPENWCPSFKYHCMRPWPLGHFQEPALPNNAKIVIFHGHPLPNEAIAGISSKWYRPVRPTPWVEQYWR